MRSLEDTLRLGVASGVGISLDNEQCEEALDLLEALLRILLSWPLESINDGPVRWKARAALARATKRNHRGEEKHDESK